VIAQGVFDLNFNPAGRNYAPRHLAADRRRRPSPRYFGGQ
jgi:hypothetical protein